MQVLHYLELSNVLSRSGIGTAVRQQRKALDRTDISVRTAPLKLGGAGDSWVDTSDFVDNIGSVPWETIENMDVVHCNMVGPGTLAVAVAANRTKTPLVLHAHVTAEDFAGSFRGSTVLSGPLKQYLERLYSRADLLCCPSTYTRRVLESYSLDTPIRALTNGVDIEGLEGHGNRRKAIRKQLDVSGMLVFSVGNVFERKGLSTVCRLAQRTPYDFAWFGPYERGPLASKSVTKWTSNPPENLTFTGWVDDIRDAYGAGDVFLFPTREENQGIAVLEAMACQKAVVVRRLPVFEEFYTHGEDCLMCETFSEFQTALERLAANPDLRDRLGEAARRTAREHSLDRVAEELSSCYESVRPSVRQSF